MIIISSPQWRAQELHGTDEKALWTACHIHRQKLIIKGITVAALVLWIWSEGYSKATFATDTMQCLYVVISHQFWNDDIMTNSSAFWDAHSGMKCLLGSCTSFVDWHADTSGLFPGSCTKISYKLQTFIYDILLTILDIYLFILPVPSCWHTDWCSRKGSQNIVKACGKFNK